MKALDIYFFIVSWMVYVGIGGHDAHAQGIQPLANDYTVVYESPDSDQMYAYSPGIVVLDDGKLLATYDIGGPGMAKQSRGRVCISGDGGDTWKEKTTFPFVHARPFVVGSVIYVLGQGRDLMIIRSDDNGETWSEPVKLTEGQKWHQAPCNVHYAHGNVYLVMERRVTEEAKGWGVGELAPVLMRGRIGEDLTKKENWTFASELSFRDVMPSMETGTEMDYFGVPFFESNFPNTTFTAPRRGSAPVGWLETNVVQFSDPNHIWYDERQQTFHLWMRAHTGGTGYACIAKVVEQGDTRGTGAMITSLEKVPSGKTILYVPCPGGQMKFHVLYDKKTELYWLLSTQSTDSMTEPMKMPADRYNLPNNERRRLQLHFSKNMVDWCFAGLVAVGPVEKASRHYASMAIDGDDLVVLSRSGDERAKDAHNGNLITFHRIKNFRKLTY